MALFAAAQALGIFVLAFAGNIPVVFLALVLMSAGAGGLVPLSLAIMPDYFGTASLGGILAIQALVAAMASMLTPTSYLLGPVLTETGPYILVLLPSLVLTLLAAFVFLKAVPPFGSSFLILRGERS